MQEEERVDDEDPERQDPYFKDYEGELKRMRRSTIVLRKLRKFRKNHEVYPSMAAAFSAVGVGSLVAWTSGAMLLCFKQTSCLPYTLTYYQLCLSMILLPMGATIGALSSGIFTQYMGRKIALQCLALPSILSWVLLLIGDSVWWLYTARAIGGIAVGIVYTIAIVYITEICRPDVRGLCCVFVHIAYMFGVLYTDSINALLNNQYYILTAACLPLPIIAALIVQLVPESPQYLIQKHELVMAVKSLERLRGVEEDIEDELEEMVNTQEGESRQNILHEKSMRKPLFFAAGLMALQQLTGLNNIIMNLEHISLGVGGFDDTSISSVIFACVTLVGDCITAGIIDRMGRKGLLMVSIGTMSVIALILIICLIVKLFANSDPLEWVTLFFLIMYGFVYCLGMGPVPWVIMAEVMPQKFRGSACGMASAVGWFICTLASASYYFMPSLIVNYVLYALFCFLGLLFIYFLLPETKGHTLEEIQQILAN